MSEHHLPHEITQSTQVTEVSKFCFNPSRAVCYST